MSVGRRRSTRPPTLRVAHIQVMVELVEPTLRLHSSWLDAHAEWGPGLHEDGFGLSQSDDVVSPAGFSAWVTRLISASDPRTVDDPTAPRCIYRWIVDGDEVLGGIALRHGDSDLIRWAGHVGYGIRPSARRRGHATWALGNILNDARLLGMNRVLLVCDADNKASAATIERNRGLFESIQVTEHGPARRYWIDTP
jgi:predicted acetyltransferase